MVENFSFLIFRNIKLSKHIELTFPPFGSPNECIKQYFLWIGSEL